MVLERTAVISNRYEVLEIHPSPEPYLEFALALDLLLERKVILKVTAPKATDRFRERFLQEAQLLSRLEHPHIVPIYDYGLIGANAYQVQRFLAGGKLSDAMEFNPNGLQVYRALRLAQRIGDSINYVHRKNILHRSLEAANILLDDDGEPYLSNFSLANFIDEKANPIRSDLYAFGNLIFQLFTGEVPLYQHERFRKPVHKVRKDLPIGLDLIIQRLTRGDEGAYQSVSDALEELQKIFFSGQRDIQGRVFLSYATKNKAYVHQLARELRNLNINIWIDQDIPKGADWGDSIETALRETDIMLLILSEASAVSEYVTHEWSFFMGSGKPVYPLCAAFIAAKGDSSSPAPRAAYHGNRRYVYRYCANY
jgi:tRNA A-37 threonylcarbamoyl transferase component Bud32